MELSARPHYIGSGCAVLTKDVIPDTIAHACG